MDKIYKLSGGILAIIYILINILQTKGILTSQQSMTVIYVLFGSCSIYLLILCCRICYKKKTIQCRPFILLILCMSIIAIQMVISYNKGF